MSEPEKIFRDSQEEFLPSAAQLHGFASLARSLIINAKVVHSFTDETGPSSAAYYDLSPETEVTVGIGRGYLFVADAIDVSVTTYIKGGRGDDARISHNFTAAYSQELDQTYYKDERDIYVNNLRVKSEEQLHFLELVDEAGYDELFRLAELDQEELAAEVDNPLARSIWEHRYQILADNEQPSVLTRERLDRFLEILKYLTANPHLGEVPDNVFARMLPALLADMKEDARLDSLTGTSDEPPAEV